MGFMSSCSKYFLCFFNFIFFVAGGAAMAAGLWILLDKKTLGDVFTSFEINEVSNVLNETNANVISLIAYCLIVAGALAFIVCFFGYCGAAVESRCLLCVYGILIIIILGLECVAVGLAHNLYSGADSHIKNVLKLTIEDYVELDSQPMPFNKTQAISATWDGIMTQMQCCGVESYKDFEKSNSWKETGKLAPAACCKKEGGKLLDGCQNNPSSSNSNFQKGCYQAVVDMVQRNQEIIIVIGSSIIFVEVLAIIMAMYLVCCHWRPQHACVDVSSRQAW
ncbi:tetraspanin-1 isoform X2 [Aphidius gifuensis]|uniref:tetraspanin-1 isoform X2 n=1 Tax=Aphidius gifuensis TaxID=684658 RepID=UPI001CDBF289|nr:tetraspanin-1 isoform X2 [Aphidius gifuensis]XP_044010709.1 tetraspanin-1 isoform X2 [Aphidius gifuensis]